MTTSIVRKRGPFDAYHGWASRYYLVCECGYEQKRRYRFPFTAEERERRKPHQCTAQVSESTVVEE